MKHASAVSLALFLGSMTLLAQTSGRDAAQPAVVSGATLGTDCPVDMRAQRQMGKGTLYFKDGRDNQPAQKLRLTLNNLKFAEITDIRITVHGLTSKGRLSPAQAAKDSADIDKTVDLKLKIGSKGNAATDLLLPAFTSVSRIDLDSVRYSDGAMWRSSAGHSCQAVPNGTMLISSL